MDTGKKPVPVFSFFTVLGVAIKDEKPRIKILKIYFKEYLIHYNMVIK